jgi:poly(A) polymerase
LNGALVKKAAVWTQDEHGINPLDVDSGAVDTIAKLAAAGYETYIVGGAVRDLMLGKKPKDFDIATEASPSQIKRCIRSARIIGKRFRLVHVYQGEKIFEVATFRSIKEGTTSNTFGTIEEDVKRRDFTMNALFYDPLKNVVIDYIGGVNDIKGRVLRPIIPLDIIFRDDPVRMIRAVKYAVIAGFDIPLKIRWKIKKDAPLLAEISASRLTEELSKIVRSSSKREIIAELFETNLWKYLQPNADREMRENATFKKAYFDGFSQPQKTPREGVSMGVAALIRPALEKSVNWKAEETPDQYKEIFFSARAFVSPINLPRFELEAALRLIYSEHQVVPRKTRLRDNRRYGDRKAKG